MVGPARRLVRAGRPPRASWRLTRDPWAVLVSEVMLQQTQVARVLPRWHEFLRRWPEPEACAAAPLEEVLRFWQGLGYPRRALALHRCAAAVARDGWPRHEAGLRTLPGVGEYTARALLSLAFDQAGAALPRDVNIARAVARAALGVEASGVAPRSLQVALEGGRPEAMSRRDYTLALFDIGALHCRAVPRCQACPLALTCVARSTGGIRGRSRRRRQPRYEGSFRQLRGSVLRAALEANGPLNAAAAAVLHPASDPVEVRRAWESLVADGLVVAHPGTEPPG